MAAVQIIDVLHPGRPNVPKVLPSALISTNFWCWSYADTPHWCRLSSEKSWQLCTASQTHRTCLSLASGHRCLGSLACLAAQPHCRLSKRPVRAVWWWQVHRLWADL